MKKKIFYGKFLKIKIKILYHSNHFTCVPIDGMPSISCIKNLTTQILLELIGAVR